LKHTRAIIDAINSGELSKVETTKDPLFGFEIPTVCPEVPREILNPRNTWEDKSLYDTTAKKLAELFKANFKKFETASSKKISDAGPV
jgi:phosphoenolpyruvate carboxykinase (ATP)